MPHCTPLLSKCAAPWSPPKLRAPGASSSDSAPLSCCCPPCERAMRQAAKHGTGPQMGDFDAAGRSVSPGPGHTPLQIAAPPSGCERPCTPCDPAPPTRRLPSLPYINNPTVCARFILRSEVPQLGHYIIRVERTATQTPPEKNKKPGANTSATGRICWPLDSALPRTHRATASEAACTGHAI